MTEVGDVVQYATTDRITVYARVVRIDVDNDRLFVSWDGGHEWIPRQDVLFVRGESVIVDGEPARITRIDRDGDIDTDAGLHYRSHLTKSK